MMLHNCGAGESRGISSSLIVFDSVLMTGGCVPDRFLVLAACGGQWKDLLSIGMRQSVWN